MDIASAYNKHKNLKLAADELGMKWQVLYRELKAIGVPVTGDKLRYGSDKDRFAAQAELEFRRIVPHAKDQNSEKFQAAFDFLVGGEKVDIKASKQNRGCAKFAARRWAFSVKKQEFCADFIVCFAGTESGWRIFLIPGEMVRMYQTISISAEQGSKSKWLQYEVSETDLADFFKHSAQEAA